MRISNVNKYEVTSPIILTQLLSGNGVGDTSTEELYIQVDNYCEIKAKGYVGDTGSDMQFTGVSTIDMFDKIETAGIYTLSAACLNKVEFDITPTDSEGVNVVIKTLL